MSEGRRAGWVVALTRGIRSMPLFGLLLLADPISATVKYGQVEISGSVESQNLLRTDDFKAYQFIQNRNTALIRFEWKWLDRGTLTNTIQVPFLERSNLYLLYRGVYDGFYDIAPGDNQRGVDRFDDLIGGPIAGNDIGAVATDPSGVAIVDDTGQPVLRGGPYSRLSRRSREAAKFENDLREAYVDLKLADLPLSFRLGRQQVVWGESDQFRLMDIWNPLDLTWHLHQEEWDKIRVPLWLIKGIWDTGRIGPLSETFVEMVWNPGDFHPGVQVEFLPYPWSIPVPDPVRSGQVQAASTEQAILLTPFFDLGGSSYKRGDFQRNPEEASDVGVRFHAVTPQGVELTTNYLYIRGRGIGAAPGFALGIEKIVAPFTGDVTNAIAADPRAPFDPRGPRALFANNIVFPAFVTARFEYPYQHVFGLTANYFEGGVTSTVFRLETAYALDEPFQTRDGRVRVTETRNDGTPCDPAVESCLQVQSPIASTKRDVWAGMVGFDRPTWIRWLNNKTTWFVTGQLFWSYVNGKVAGLRGGVISAGEAPYFSPQDPLVYGPELVQNHGLGRWQSGPFAGQRERVQNASSSGDYADDVRRWEVLASLGTLSFYRGGTLVPFLAVAYDFVNTGLLSQLKLDWFVTNNLIVQPQAKLFTKFHGGNVLDPWIVGAVHRRDEVGLKIIWQF